MDKTNLIETASTAESRTRAATSKRTRRRRTDKPTKRAGCLTVRDLEILTFIGRSRVASTDAIALAFFSDRSTASRRLGRLLGSGLLRIQVESLNASNLYTLTDRAAETLVMEGVDEESLHVGRFPKREALDHLRYLAELRAAFLVGVRARTDLRLDLFLTDHDLRRMAGDRVPSYVPDALVKLSTVAESVGLLVEFDCGHQTAKLIAETKGRATRLAAEAQAPLWGLAPWRALFIAPTAARLRSVAQALVGEGAGAFWLGTHVEQLATLGVFGAAYGSITRIASTPRGESLPLTESFVPSLAEGGAS